MTFASEMLESHPRANDVDERLLAAAVESTIDAAQSATACADACLAEHNTAALARCIRACLDAAEVCGAASRVFSRSTETDWRVGRALAEAAIVAARACAEECEKWGAEHRACRICADACRSVEEALGLLLDGV
jgi:hypothetical protein